MEYSKAIKSVIVDPRCKFNYASYFIEGLSQTDVQWKFALDDSFKSRMLNWDNYRRGFCMLIEMTDGRRIRVYIDNHDANNIKQDVYDWCDVYATVNIDKSLMKEKILPLGPTCGLKVFGLMKLLNTLLQNYLLIIKSKCYNPGLKNMLSDYLYTIVRRLRYSEYSEQGSSLKDYCFAISTLWYDDITDKETNNWRYVFTKVCKKVFPIFEGGFFLIKGAEVEWPKYSTYAEKYKGMIYKKRIPMKEYLQKTKKSALVFNTPSVSLCLGWKLSEYLMLGKAIISTNISNAMPGDFRPNEHYLLVNSEKEIEEATRLIRDDDALRNKLEHNARQFFEEYLSPAKMIERIVQFAINQESKQN